MKLVSVSIKNFRCYKDEFTLSIGDLTTFIGRNDIGKSTVLEALNAFFNDVLEQADLNTQCNENELVEITCEFLGFPEKITIDSSSETTFKDEYLLTSRNNIKKDC
ncbi:MAG: AAA family ATPase [Thiotrichaceae bacterium]|nr:AAA family ATPase [Thiotrichaceae bacterium]